MNSRFEFSAAWPLVLLLCAPRVLRADTPPEVIDPPLTQFAWLGRPVTFKVSVTRPTPMTYQWQWGGGNLPDATNKIFRIQNAQIADTGEYRVLLANSAGVVTSAVARLTVREWPQPTGVSFTNLNALEANLKTLFRNHAVRGASVAIMKDGRLISARGYGYADPENSDERVQPDSLFRVASLTKAITATATLKLVDEGRLNLDDKVFLLLNLPAPIFPGAKVDPRLTNITVRHLLNHTGGWNYDTAKNPEGRIGFDPQYWFERCAQDLGVTNGLSIRDLVGWITGFPLQSKPGAAWAYSNSGYIILGALIEQITGRRYEEVVKSLLAKADVTRLQSSTFIRSERRPDEVVQWLSPLYNIRSSWLRVQFPSAITAELAYHYPRKLWPSSGGLATSPMDYARFVNAIDRRPAPPDLLTTNAVTTMLTTTAPSQSAGEPYGMGWWIDSSNGEIWHTGILPESAHTRVVRRLDGVTYVAFCSTYDDDLFDALKATLDSGVSAIKSWPTNDLFPATMSYEAWQARHFTSAELSQSEVSGDNADPDGDGISNLIEYAQGLDPKAADQEPWLRARLVGERNQLQFALEYRRRPLGHAVAYVVEFSNDLKKWQPFEAAAAEKLEADGMVAVTLTDVNTNASSGSRFFRLKVSRAQPNQ